MEKVNNQIAMKQFITFIFSILLSLNFAFAQEEGKKEVKYTNPFEQAGIKNVKIATLSQGKYQEFHDLDSIVQIGTTLINVNTRQIVGYVANDSTNILPSPTLISRWISVDPLAERHYDLTPYNFVENNPMNMIDPDGRDGIKIIDKENKTITIKAVYYVQTVQSGSFKNTSYSSKDVTKMNEAINQTLNKKGYTVSEGDYSGYTVTFDLEFREGGEGFAIEAKEQIITKEYQ